MLARAPVSTGVAVMALALGIGASTAVFSLVHHLLLAPLPYPEPDRLVRVSGVDLRQGAGKGLSGPEVEDLGHGVRSFSAIAAVSPRAFVLRAADEPEKVLGAAVSPELFAVLRVGPTLGRLLSVADAAPGAPPVALIRARLWRRRFGGDGGVIGRRVELDGRAVNIVGVLPDRVEFPSRESEVWVPSHRDERLSRSRRSFAAVARLTPDGSRDRAAGEADVVAARLRAAYPDVSEHLGFRVARIEDERVAKVRTRLLLLQGAVVFVLLIACANVANLLLARGSARRREVAVRAALGAGRPRLIRQFLVESLLLAGAAGALGAPLAAGLLRLLLAAAPDRAAAFTDVAVDGPALAFATAVSLATGTLFGLGPALRAAAVGAGDVLKRTTVTGASFGRDRLRAGFLSVEVALSLVLLVGAGLLTRAYAHLDGVDPGFDPSHGLAFDLDAPEAEFPDEGDVERYYRVALERVRSVPGVVAAGAVDVLPLVGWNPGTAFTAERGGGATPVVDRADLQPVTPGYFRAMGLSLLRGRSIAETEILDAPRVVLVNRRFAAGVWPGEDPVGRRLRLDGEAGNAGPWLTVVGVAGDVRQFGVQFEPRPEIYVPGIRRTMTLVVRTSPPPERLLDPLLAALRSAGPTLPRPRARTLADVVADALAMKRLAATAFSALSAVALLLASIGVYGVISHAVTRRTREIGIRLALGAEPRRVARQVLGQCLGPILAGAAAGLVGSLALTPLLRSQLHGISPLDPATFAAATATLAAVGVAACWGPARVAARMDPVAALREE